MCRRLWGRGVSGSLWNSAAVTKPFPVVGHASVSSVLHQWGCSLQAAIRMKRWFSSDRMFSVLMLLSKVTTFKLAQICFRVVFWPWTMVLCFFNFLLADQIADAADEVICYSPSNKDSNSEVQSLNSFQSDSCDDNGKICFIFKHRKFRAFTVARKKNV